MAAPFTFRFGSLDLADFLCINPDEGWDPFDPDMVEPQLSQSPLREGAAHIQDVIGAREMVWPLGLNAPNKASLHGLEQQVAAEADKAGVLALEWKDQGASQSTFFDVIRARVEPEPNYRRSAANWQRAQLRVWAQPYGHTGTVRMVASFSGTGAAIRVPVPSAVIGDHPARSRTLVELGSYVWQEGRFIAVAPLPHPSWLPVIPAGSMALAGGVTLIGASGAHGSQAIRVIGGAGPVQAARFTMGPASIYQGRPLRLLAIARGDRSMSIRRPRQGDQTGELFGQVGLASALRFKGWGVVDLGRAQLPDDPGFRTQDGFGGTNTYGVTVEADVGDAFSHRGQSVPNTSLAPLEVSAVIVLPDDDMTSIAQRSAELLHADNFERPGQGTALSLVGQSDPHGLRWDVALDATAGLGTVPLTLDPFSAIGGGGMVGPFVYGTAPALRRFANQLHGLPSLGYRHRLEAIIIAASAGPFDGSAPTTTWGINIGGATRRTIAGTLDVSPQWAWAELREMGSGALLHAGANQFFFGTALLASMWLPSQPNPGPLRLEYNAASWYIALEPITQGSIAQRAAGSITPYASVAATQLDNPLTPYAGHPGLHMLASSVATAAPDINGGGVGAITAFRGFHIPFNSFSLAGDGYILDSIADTRSRYAGATNWFTEDVAAEARGGGPYLAPSAPAVAVVAASLDCAAANDLLDVEVRAQERFRFSR